MRAVYLWDCGTSKIGASGKHRYVIADANTSNGHHKSAVSVNSSGRWKIGIESMDKNGRWNPLDISAKFNGETGTLSAGGMTLNLTRTSDGGYEDDGLGFTSVGGEMIEFDLTPNKASWSDRSYTYRPGLGAPSAKGGKAIYDTGKKDSIGKTWQENASKGNTAKIYDGNKTWIGEWIGGPQPEYFFGRREDKERTQWFAGGGDGILVWDHNGKRHHRRRHRTDVRI